MKTKLVRIGNSRGIRIPKPFIEEAGLDEEVELEVHGNTVVIRPSQSIRAGWATAAAALAATATGLLDPAAATDFDRSDWTW
ncbi:MAG: AbrB/MazE/SpoVT family DNA-binding domain-containing protein [Gemmatimonadales bacterium]|nr:AbrB/MazE/SpoVT family DNA-binding domain-containing protein [Gemmatimonadales bacterium]